MNNHHQIRREIFVELAPKMKMLKLNPRPPISKREFADRHFRRADAFVLGMFAGAALITIGFAIACFFSR